MPRMEVIARCARDGCVEEATVELDVRVAMPARRAGAPIMVGEAVFKFPDGWVPQPVLDDAGSPQDMAELLCPGHADS